MPIIEVDHVTKEFRLGQLTTFKQAIVNGARRMLGGTPAHLRTFKALDDVSLTVDRGEVIGIIGHNGAGKSTLLKLLANISRPTTGTVTVCGSVSPLIAVGAGLVWDLTGRENVYLNATILGMSRKEIGRKFDEIVAFAELEQFIDTPVKRYSSGMQVRLGFSVATAVSSDILIVDEVLAVGDLAFQKKCYDRMDDLIHRQKRTVLIVGHNIRQLARFCSRMILLDHGRIELDGDPSTVSNRFHRRTSDRAGPSRKEVGELVAQATTGEIAIDEVTLSSGGVERVTEVPMGQGLLVRILLRSFSEIRGLSVDVGIHTADFVFVTRTNTAMGGVHPDLPAGEHVVECVVDRIALNPDSYALGITVRDRYERLVWQGANISKFTVVPGGVERERLPIHTALIYLPFRFSIPSLRLVDINCDPITPARLDPGDQTLSRDGKTSTPAQETEDSRFLLDADSDLPRKDCIASKVPKP
jgi:ABC-type polysaccharide/polyol phosphate transport system ATPase subunit